MPSENGKTKMQPDIIDRLRAYAEVNEMTGAYTEANCALAATEEIKKLREQVLELAVALELERESGGFGI